MATTHQPLLDTPKRNSSHCKALYLVLSVAVIIGPISLVTIRLINTTSSDPLLLPHNHDQSHDFSYSGGSMDGVLQKLLQSSTSHIQSAMVMATDINHRINDPREQAAIADCLELMELSINRVMDSIASLGNRTAWAHSNAHTWLSSVLTNHVTCLDGLNGPAQSIRPIIKDLISSARTSLAMVVAIAITPLEEAEVMQPLNGKFPNWVSSRDRKLLEASTKDIKANVVVATDGSDNYKTVKETVASAPKNGNTRYVIYLKKGTYKEKIDIASNNKNMMIVGDGMDSTIITGSLNIVDRTTTFNSVTLGK